MTEELTKYRKKKLSVVLDHRPQERVIQIEQEDGEDVAEHVIQIEQEGGEHRPKCKLCFSTNTSNFIKGQVCYCTGSMAYMCRDCIWGIFEHIDQYPRAYDGWPLCRDCGGRFRLNEMRMSFGEYLQITTGTSLTSSVSMIIVLVILFALLIWALTGVNLPEQFSSLGSIFFAWVTMALCFVGSSLISSVYSLGYHYDQYRTRAHTEVYGVEYEEEPKIQDPYL